MSPAHTEVSLGCSVKLDRVQMSADLACTYQFLATSCCKAWWVKHFLAVHSVVAIFKTQSPFAKLCHDGEDQSLPRILLAANT